MTPADRAIAHIAKRAAATAGSKRVVGPTLEHARVTLSFHPDRLRRDGLTVAEGLLRDGFYRSQFDTGVTSGSPTAYPGGQRDIWEEQLFGGAYHQTDEACERPKYGALNVMGHPDGGSPRFGSCFFELAPTRLSRCTFCWGDSHEGPAHVGTIEHLDGVLEAWLEAVGPSAAAHVATLQYPPSGPPGRSLDVYIEAQVHGPIDLASDIDALVIDPAFEETETGAHLAAIAARWGFPLRRHSGFILRPVEIPPDFRGPQMRPLAERIAGGSNVDFDVVALGHAARELGGDPEVWQQIKQLWHCLVRFGRERR